MLRCMSAQATALCWKSEQSLTSPTTAAAGHNDATKYLTASLANRGYAGCQTRPMTTRAHQTIPGRWAPFIFLAALVAVLATVFGTAIASAATTTTAETRVGAHNHAVDVLVEPTGRETAGQRLGKDVAGPGIVVATGVAANGAPRTLEDVGNGPVDDDVLPGTVVYRHGARDDPRREVEALEVLRVDAVDVATEVN